MKKTLCVCLLLLCLVPSLFSCTGKQPVRTAEEVAAQIEIGMQFDEVVSIVGEDGKDVGSGMVIYEWKMPDGKYLRVSFEGPAERQTIHDYYAVGVRVTDTPFRGPAQ